jgi:demethylmenaquinone methyltransferase/2-methoxy-6-polyprenyl-1,4-benzoquinol methylase
MQPHPLLTEHYRSAKEKQRFLRKVFDQSAPHYEAILRWSSFGRGELYRRQALVRNGLRRGMRVLDVASGTGPAARAAATILGGERAVVCLDASSGMLLEARRRFVTDYVQGEADRLPFRNETFDFIIMGYALRHVERLEGTFAEYFRVLKPGGKVLILEITKPTNRLGQSLMRLYFRDTIPWLTQRFTRSREAGEMMRYYWETIDQVVAPSFVLTALAGAGFARVGRHVVLRIFSEYLATKP